MSFICTYTLYISYLLYAQESSPELPNSREHSTSFHHILFKDKFHLACLAKLMTQQDKINERAFLKFSGVL